MLMVVMVTLRRRNHDTAMMAVWRASLKRAQNWSSVLLRGPFRTAVRDHCGIRRNPDSGVVQF
eukprot:15435012-Alexandrium_andersonii.AAC.1